MTNFELIISNELSEDDLIESYKNFAIRIMNHFVPDFELSNFDISDIEKNIKRWLSLECIIEKI